MAHRLDPLLRPRSIAVLGATEREGTVGRHTIENLLKGGYEGGLARYPYGLPAPWGIDSEELIVNTVHEMVSNVRGQK